MRKNVEASKMGLEMKRLPFRSSGLLLGLFGVVSYVLGPGPPLHAAIGSVWSQGHPRFLDPQDPAGDGRGASSTVRREAPPWMDWILDERPPQAGSLLLLWSAGLESYPGRTSELDELVEGVSLILESPRSLVQDPGSHMDVWANWSRAYDFLQPRTWGKKMPGGIDYAVCRRFERVRFASASKSWESVESTAEWEVLRDRFGFEFEASLEGAASATTPEAVAYAHFYAREMLALYLEALASCGDLESVALVLERERAARPWDAGLAKAAAWIARRDGEFELASRILEQCVVERVRHTARLAGAAPNAEEFGWSLSELEPWIAGAVETLPVGDPWRKIHARTSHWQSDPEVTFRIAILRMQVEMGLGPQAVESLERLAGMAERAGSTVIEALPKVLRVGGLLGPEVIDVLRAARGLAPGEHALGVELARRLRIQRRWDEAEALLVELRSFPTLPPSVRKAASAEEDALRLALAEVRRSGGSPDSQSSLDQLRRAHQDSPGDLTRALALGRALEEARDFEGALEVGRTVLVSEPANATAGELVERCLTALDRLDELEQALRRRWEASPQGTVRDELAMRLGSFAQFRGDKAQVQELLEHLWVRPPSLHPDRSTRPWFIAHGDLEGASRGQHDVAMDWLRDGYERTDSGYQDAFSRWLRMEILLDQDPFHLWLHAYERVGGKGRRENLDELARVARLLRSDPGVDEFLDRNAEFFQSESGAHIMRAWSRAAMALARGDAVDALAALDRCVEEIESHGFLMPARVAAAREAGDLGMALRLLTTQVESYRGDPERWVETSLGRLPEPVALLAEQAQLARWVGRIELAEQFELEFDESVGKASSLGPGLILQLEQGRRELVLARMRGTADPDRGRWYWGNQWMRSFLVEAQLVLDEASVEEFLSWFGMEKFRTRHPLPEFESQGARVFEGPITLLDRAQALVASDESAIAQRLADLRGSAVDREPWIELRDRARRAGSGAIYLEALGSIAAIDDDDDGSDREAWFEALLQADPSRAATVILGWLGEPVSTRGELPLERGRRILIEALSRLDRDSDPMGDAIASLSTLETEGRRLQTWINLDRALDPEGEFDVLPGIEEKLQEMDAKVRFEAHREALHRRAVRAGNPRSRVRDRLDRLQGWGGFDGVDPEYPALLEMSGMGAAMRAEVERDPLRLAPRLGLAYGEYSSGSARSALERLEEVESIHPDHAGLRGAIWTLHRHLGDQGSADLLERDWIRRVRRGSAWSPGAPKLLGGRPRDTVAESADFLEALRRIEGREGSIGVELGGTLSSTEDPRLRVWRLADLGSGRPDPPERFDTDHVVEWTPESVPRADSALGPVAWLCELGRYGEAAEGLRFREMTDPIGPPGHRAYGLALAHSSDSRAMDRGFEVLWREYLRPFEDLLGVEARLVGDRAVGRGGPRGSDLDALIRASIVAGREEDMLDRLGREVVGSEHIVHFGCHRVRDGLIRALMHLGRAPEALGVIRSMPGFERTEFDVRRLELQCLMRMMRFEEALPLQRALYREQAPCGRIADPPRVQYVVESPGRIRFDWGKRSWGGSAPIRVYSRAETLHEGRRLAMLLAKLGRKDEYADLVEELLNEKAQGSRGRALEGLLEELVLAGLEKDAMDLMLSESVDSGSGGIHPFERTWGAVVRAGASSSLRALAAEQALEVFGEAWPERGPREETVLELLVGSGLEPEVAERRLRRVRALEPREPHWVILEARRLDGLGKEGEALSLLDRWVLLELAHGEEIPPEVDAWRGLIGHRIAPSKRSRAQLARAWVEGLGWRSTPDGWRRRMEGELRGALGL